MNFNDQRFYQVCFHIECLKQCFRVFLRSVRVEYEKFWACMTMGQVKVYLILIHRQFFKKPTELFRQLNMHHFRYGTQMRVARTTSTLVIFYSILSYSLLIQVTRPYFPATFTQLQALRTMLSFRLHLFSSIHVNLKNPQLAMGVEHSRKVRRFETFKISVSIYRSTLGYGFFHCSDAVSYYLDFSVIASVFSFLIFDKRSKSWVTPKPLEVFPVCVFLIWLKNL